MRHVWMTALLCIILCGCKVNILPPTSGSVHSQSGEYACTTESPCSIDVVDIHFNETFVAEAPKGYAFTAWSTENFGMCGGQTSPCNLDSSIYEFYPDFIWLLDPVYAFPLTPIFQKHDRNGYSGSWQGDVTGSINLGFFGNTDTNQVSITASEETISIEEDRFFEDTVCRYEGIFNHLRKKSRIPREGISGTFECNTFPKMSGVFDGEVFLSSKNILILGLNKTFTDDRVENATLSLARFPQNSNGTAIAVGRKFSESDAGYYEGVKVISGEACDGFSQDVRGSTEFDISFEKGKLHIFNDDFFGPSCEFKQTSPKPLFETNAMSGTYECNDFSSGKWNGKELYAFDVGEHHLFRMEIQLKNVACGTLEIGGIRPHQSQSDNPLTDDLLDPIPCITCPGLGLSPVGASLNELF
jgi:hypothetical protein